MRPVRFETVKLLAQREANLIKSDSAFYAILEGLATNTPWKFKLQELQELVWKTIDQWDVRCVKSLHKLFPNILPKYCQYQIEQQNGKWWIVG